MRIATYENDCETSERNEAIAAELIRLMSVAGWSKKSQYEAAHGSVYLKFEQPGDDGLVSGKIRIADHSEQSENHVTPEIEVLSDFDQIDWSELVEAVGEGWQGQW